VLAVADLGAPKLRLAPAAGRGDQAVVAGFPEDGPLAAEPARIRSTVQASGKDIYNEAGVTREVYALRATVLPGNSGGPLLAPNGRVYGVVFAASTRDDETGYALTADEVAPDIVAGVRATEPVSTGRCLD
jgi:S1-C subfamily serine protease